ncbi:arylsulfatase J-like isoform X2 [Ptychodera flava]|uniref:arylsulfatase J-like isoform X2 n=1 Tax=Ptychodera flava TaxID=63121 RepID=UPI00396A2702
MFMYMVIFCVLALFDSSAGQLDKPNILFVLADDLGWAEIGYNNHYVKTPNLDRLASEGVILNQSYVQQSCSPWHLGFCKREYTPHGRGFDRFYGMYLATQDHYTHMEAKGLDLNENGNPDWSKNGTYSTDLYTDKAIEYIQEHDTDKPMFMYLAYPTVHDPLQVPDKYRDMYPEGINENRRIKLGMITSLDDGVQKVVTALQDNGMWNNTLLIFLSDNGGPVNDKYKGNNWPLRGSKKTMFEGGTRVVSFVHGTMLEKTGYVNDGLIHVVDWYPTLLSLVGGIPDSDMDGLNVWATLSKNESSPRTEFVYNIDYTDRFPCAAIRMGDYKLILGKAGNPGSWVPPDEANGTFGNATYTRIKRKDSLLYNIKDDPTERYNLAKQMPDKVEEMSARIRELKVNMVPALDVGIKSRKSSPRHFNNVWSSGWC